MILTNDINEQVIRILNANFNANTGIVIVDYEVKENIKESGIVKKINFNAQDIETQNNILLKSYNSLLKLEEFQAFKINQDNQNWLFTGRNIRLYIDNDLIIEAITTNNPLSVIIERLKIENLASEKKFIFQGKQQTVVYINEVLSDDAPVISEYITTGRIIIENKI